MKWIQIKEYERDWLMGMRLREGPSDKKLREKWNNMDTKGIQHQGERPSTEKRTQEKDPAQKERTQY